MGRLYTPHTESTSFHHNGMNHILRGKLEYIAEFSFDISGKWLELYSKVSV